MDFDLAKSYIKDLFTIDKKIYSGRYATDCFKEGMAPKTLKSGTSLYEIDVYKSIKAMLEELKKQRGYFANDFVKLYPRE